MKKLFVIGLITLTGVNCMALMTACSNNSKNNEETTVSVESEGNIEDSTEYWEPEPSYGTDEYEQENKKEPASESVYETYGDGFGEYGEYPTYDEYLASIAQETLSSSQAESGYQIIDGNIVGPNEEPEMDADKNSRPVIVGGVVPNESTGYVTFDMTVPNGIEETAFVALLSENTFKSYSALLYAVNEYNVTIALPSGRYIFDECGLTSDPDSRYWAETQEFIVEAGSSQDIEIELIDSKAKTTN